MRDPEALERIAFEFAQVSTEHECTPNLLGSVVSCSPSPSAPLGWPLHLLLLLNAVANVDFTFIYITSEEGWSYTCVCKCVCAFIRI